LTPGKQTEVDRLAALVDRKLAAMERQKRPPSLAELNATRRLIDWLNRERQVARSRELTRELTPVTASTSAPSTAE
jgi:hypothetical protein